MRKNDCHLSSVSPGCWQGWQHDGSVCECVCISESVRVSCVTERVCTHVSVCDFAHTSVYRHVTVLSVSVPMHVCECACVCERVYTQTCV
jgi:hypothetical protein